jgi:hypothetical protein
MSRHWHLLFPGALVLIGCGGTDGSAFNDPSAAGDTGSVVVDDSGSSDSPSTTDAGGCAAGKLDKRSCGQCGNQLRVCNAAGTWSEWSLCTDETGECMPGASDSATCEDGRKKTRKCTSTCTWGEYGACEGFVPDCKSGATEKGACGNCGSRVRVCSAGGTWSDWSVCSDEGACAAGATSEETCTTGGKRSRTCSDACTWGAWSACPSTGELWVAKVSLTSTSSTSSSAVTIERIKISDETSAGSISLPTSSTGGKTPLTLSGSSISDGQLVRSSDKKYVTLAGYGVAPGTSDVSASSTSSVPRVLARIDTFGAVDTSTSTTSFSSAAIRGAASVDGSVFYAFGPNGILRVPFGSSGAATSITTGDVGLAGFFGGKLYLTKYQSTGGTVLFYSDPPLTSLAPTMLLDSNPSSFDLASPYGMVALSVNGTAIDRIYIADDRTGGGIDQWSLSGTTWSKIKTITPASDEDVRYVTGFVRGTDVVLYATLAGTSTSRVVTYVDTGTATIPVARTLRTGSSLSAYRGLTLGAE